MYYTYTPVNRRNIQQFVNQIFRSTAGQAMFNILKRNHYNPIKCYDELRMKGECHFNIAG